MRLWAAHRLMRLPDKLWRRLPGRMKDWAIEQHMLTYVSYRRLRVVRDGEL